MQAGALLCALLLPFLLPAAGSGAPPTPSHTVLIDAAHGGDDPGVVSDGLREKELTLKLALMIREEAAKSPGIVVQLTRSSDRTVTLRERAAAVAAVKAELLVALHVNAGFGKGASGYEFYYPGFRQPPAGGEGASPIIKDMVRTNSLNDAVMLAQSLQKALDPLFPRKGRGLRDAPSPLLDGLAIPGLILEVGFATDPADRKRLGSEETQRAVARAVVKGLKDYLRQGP